MTWQPFPPSVADVTKTLSPHTIGEDQPSPGIAVFHATWVEASQDRGSVASAESPCPVGPRKRGQLDSDCAQAGAARRTSARAVFIRLSAGRRRFGSRGGLVVRRLGGGGRRWRRRGCRLLA